MGTTAKMTYITTQTVYSAPLSIKALITFVYARMFTSPSRWKRRLRYLRKKKRKTHPTIMSRCFSYNIRSQPARDAKKQRLICGWRTHQSRPTMRLVQSKVIIPPDPDATNSTVVKRAPCGVETMKRTMIVMAVPGFCLTWQVDLNHHQGVCQCTYGGNAERGKRG